MNDKIIQNVLVHKQLGMVMVMSQTLDWSEHVTEICEKSLKRTGAWKRAQYILSRQHFEICMSLFVFPILHYGDIPYDNCSELDTLKAENF